MWIRLGAAASICLLISCNTLLGIHELDGADGAVATDGRNASCRVDPAYSGTPLAGEAFVATGSDHFEFYDTNLSVMTVLQVVLNPGTPDFPGSDVKPGLYDLGSTEDSQYATCGSCVMIFTDVGSGGALGSASQFYLATSGTLKVTSTQGTFTALITNSVLDQLDLDASGQSSLDASGCSTYISSMTLSAPLTSD